MSMTTVCTSIVNRLFSLNFQYFQVRPDNELMKATAAAKKTELEWRLTWKAKWSFTIQGESATHKRSLSAHTCRTCFFRRISSFSIRLRAYTFPLSLWTTFQTSPKAPFPTISSSWKSWSPMPRLIRTREHSTLAFSFFLFFFFFFFLFFSSLHFYHLLAVSQNCIRIVRLKHIVMTRFCYASTSSLLLVQERH